MEYRRLTALEQIADRCALVNDAARNARADGFAERQAYREGESVGLTYAYNIMKKELARLQNLYQNGALRASDFDQW